MRAETRGARVLTSLEKFKRVPRARVLSRTRENVIAIDRSPLPIVDDDSRGSRAPRRVASRLRRALARSFRARAINFHFALLSGMGGRFWAACRISQGNGNRFEERRCETAVGNTPSVCTPSYSYPLHLAEALHAPLSVGPSLRCPIPTRGSTPPFRDGFLFAVPIS